MQIRVRKTTWALIRTRYDSTRKRGVAHCLGTVSMSADRVPEALASMLTPPEREHIEVLLRRARGQRDAERRQHYARILPLAIDFATEWYLDPRSESAPRTQLAHDTREAFSKLLSAMVKAGVGRKRKRQAGAAKPAKRTERVPAKRP